ncbi:MAG: tetratricopeptide repeat protein [bacterium]
MSDPRHILPPLLAGLLLVAVPVAGVLAQGDAPQEVLSRARRLEVRGELEAAAGLLAPLYREDPSHTAVFLAYYRLLQRLDRGDEELQALELRLQAVPGDPRALGWKGDRLLEEGERSAALALWRRMAEGSPSDPGMWRMAGARMQAAGAREEALTLYRRARQALEDPAALAPEAARALMALGRHVEAGRELLDYLRAEPGRAAVVQTLLSGIPYTAPIAEELAAMAAERAGEADDPALFHRMAGRIRLYAGQSDQALPHFRRADRLAGARGMVLTELARTESIRGAWGAAERVWQAVLEEDPPEALAVSARLGRGRALLRLERPTEALEALRGAAAAPPGERVWSEAVLLFARAAREAGREEEARRAYERLSRLAPDPGDRWEGSLGVAGLLLAAGRPDSARVIYEEVAAEADPGEGEATARRARLGAARTLLYLGRVEKAGERIDRAAEAGSGGPDFTGVLERYRRTRLVGADAAGGAARFGRALLAADGGRHAEAALLLEDLAEEVAGPAREEVLFALARSHAARGDSLAAAGTWREASGIDGALQPDRALYEEARIVWAQREARAREALEEMMTRYPESPWAEGARTLLRRIVEGP